MSFSLRRSVLLILVLPVCLQFRQLLTLTNTNGATKQPSTGEEAGVISQVSLRTENASNTLSSSVVCVGDNMRSGWAFLSCQFRQLCYQGGRFGLIRSKEQAAFQDEWKRYKNTSQFSRLATDWNLQLSTKGHNVDEPDSFGLWFPETFYPSSADYLQLPSQVVWIPFTYDSTISNSSTRVAFDYLLPIYNLQLMFASQNKTALVTLLNDDACQADCLIAFQDYLSLIGAKLFHPTTENATITCAQFGMAGVGYLTDHGGKGHGTHIQDYLAQAHNVGRGALIFEFTRRILNRIRSPRDPLQSSNRQQAKRLIWASALEQTTIHDVSNTFTTLSMKRLDRSKSLQHQIEQASTASIYLSAPGDDALPAAFLPRGGTVVLLFDPSSRVEGQRNRRPVLEDWDLWNHMSHITVHWLPRDTASTAQILVDILRNELEDMTLDHFDQPPHDLTRPNLPPPDGLFYGLPVRRGETAHFSSVHCLGDMHRDSKTYRSCRVRNMCMEWGQNTTPRYAISPSQAQLALQNTTNQFMHKFAVVNSRMNLGGAMMGLNVRTSHNSEWFPNVRVPTTAQGRVFQLEDDVVLVPILPDYPNIRNPGHLVWDFFLPVYTLLRMYGWEDKKLLMTEIDDSCRIRAECWSSLSKFLPLMGINATDVEQGLMLSRGSNSELFNGTSQVCAQNGAFGIGMLTDHGLKRHGQTIYDYTIVHNAGRGHLLYQFRNYMLQNMGLPETHVHRNPFTITFSVNSSRNPSRRLDFKQQITASQRSFTKDVANIRQYKLGEMPLRQQLLVTLESSIFVSAVGGSTMTASFLSRGACLVLYYDETSNFVGSGPNKMEPPAKNIPSMLDFDFWNNASYLRVHWLSIGSMNEKEDVNFFVRLLENEIYILQSS